MFHKDVVAVFHFLWMYLRFSLLSLGSAINLSNDKGINVTIKAIKSALVHSVVAFS